MTRPRASTKIRAARHAKEIARWMGHGTPMLDDYKAHEPLDEWDGHGPDPHGRTPIGPFDVTVHLQEHA